MTPTVYVNPSAPVAKTPASSTNSLQADQARREAISAADAARAEHKASQNPWARRCATHPRGKREPARPGTELSNVVKGKEEAQRVAEASVHDPTDADLNIVEGAPAGGEEDFVVLEKVGTLPQFDFEPKDHLELGESLGIIDMERGGSIGFALLLPQRCGCSAAARYSFSLLHRRPCSTGLN